MIELRNAYLFGIPPSNWLARFACKVVGAHTFHWGILICKDKDGWLTSESLGKGTAVSRFVYPVAHIYRIKDLDFVPTTPMLLSFHSWQGDTVYDMPVNFLSGIWFLLKHYLKIAIPIISNHTYNCQEWVCYMASCLGVPLIPHDEYPYCKNLENSQALEYLGEFRQ